MKTILKWLKRISISLLGLIIVTLIILYISFSFWIKNAVKELPKDTTLMETDYGPIEYSLDGNSDRYMLMVHGTPGSVHASRGEASTFTNKGFTVLAVSRPGYFNTPLSSGETPKQQAALFNSLLDKLKIESVYVNGVSGGGPSSLQFAIDYPDRCAGLILRAAISEKYIVPESESLIEKFFGTEFGIWTGFQIQLRKADEKTREMIELYLKRSMFPFKASKIGWDNDIYQFTKMADPELEKVKAPTLILHGNRDENVPFSHAEHASKRIPNATLFEMPGKTHYVFFTSYADTINQEIVQFINKQEQLKD